MPSGSLSHVVKKQEESHINQFLMYFMELGTVKAALMNREGSPDLDTCFEVVLSEEIQLQSQSALSY